MIKQYLSGVWKTLTFRGGPQQLPYSPLILVLLVLFALGLVFALVGKQALLFASNLAFIMMVIWVLLFFLKKQQRYVQTMTAFLSCEWIISVLFMLVWFGILLIAALGGHLKGVSSNNLMDIFNVQISQNSLPSGLFMFLGLGVLALLIWKFLIDVSILKQATEWKTGRTVIFIIVLNLLPALVEQSMVKSGASSATHITAPASVNKTISLNP